MAERLVEVGGLSHCYGSGETRKQVLFDNSLHLDRGEIVIMTGPSGSGKTTLLTLAGALRSVQAGSVRVAGRELAGLAPAELVAVRRGIGFIFQQHNLFESLSALENVGLGLELACPERAPRESRAAAMLERLGLAERLHHKPQALSGGQRQRVAIGRALAGRPPLVLADEPTAALDQDSGRQVVSLLRSLASEDGAAILMVTHDSRILDVADRIVNMVDGRVVSDVAVNATLEAVGLLQRCPLFASHPPSTLAELAQWVERERFAAGDTLIRQGEAGDKFYVIAEGAVEVRRADAGAAPRTVATLHGGDFFGETALLTGEPRNATIVATAPVLALTLDQDRFRAALARTKSLAEQLREAIYQRR
ncbi:MAG: ATP-binding cassette domain-containing protein [Vicinamibacteria bacterium]